MLIFVQLADSNFLLTPNQKLAKHMDEDYDGMVNTMNAQQAQPREISTAAKSTSPEYNYALLVLLTWHFALC